MPDLLQFHRRLARLAGDGIHLEVAGRTGELPIHVLSCPAAPGSPTALLLAGTHGDEPAGVEAALACLRPEEAWRWRGLGLVVVPCLNPHGYQTGTRENRDGVDVNWAYARDDVPEVAVLRRLVAGRRFAFVLDFHEDWESPGYYLYELRRGAPLVGPLVTRRVGAVCPLNIAPEIEGLPAADGLVAPDAEAEVERRGAGIPLAMFFSHTDHLLTSESPTALDLEIRVQAHLVTLEVVATAHGGGPTQERGDTR